MSEERQKMFRQLAEYSHIGMTFVFSIIIGFGIGWFLDNKAFGGKTSPYLTFIFFGFGIGAGFKNLWELTKEYQMESKASNQQELVDPGVRLVRSVTGFSWLLTIVLSVGSLFMFGQLFALSVVLGGVLINISFLLLQKDLRQLFTKISRAGDHAAAVSRTEKIRFYVKFYARLIILGLLLIALVSNMALNMIGLTLGLTTVMFSVIVVVLGKGKTFYSEQSLRSV